MKHLLGILALLALAAPACQRESKPTLSGTWRATLASAGGELPFTLEIKERELDLTAWAVNGPERAEFTHVSLTGDQVSLRFAGYDSRIQATLSQDGTTLRGEWTKTQRGYVTRMPFAATRGQERFLPPVGQIAPGSVQGQWAVRFTDPEESYPAIGEFKQDGTRVTGTFLTDTGDYRYLAGDFDGKRLRLSCFDGAHAYLFSAELQPDGRLTGHHWSRDRYEATWEAKPRAEGAPVLANAYKQTRVGKKFTFGFPSTDGDKVALSDARFRGKVLLVDLFGTWCPNCNDQAPVLARWHKRWKDEGLEIVGLAFEMTGDAARDMSFVKLYGERHGIEYPLLLAGTSDKDLAARKLPGIRKIKAFPTTLFIDRAGKVRRVHTGFMGPATGDAHQTLIAEQEALLRELLAEKPPRRS